MLCNSRIKRSTVHVHDFLIEKGKIKLVLFQDCEFSEQTADGMNTEKSASLHLTSYRY